MCSFIQFAIHCYHMVFIPINYHVHSSTVCIWVLIFSKPCQSGHMIKVIIRWRIDATIALASMMCVLGSNYYELHPMDEKSSLSFSLYIKS